MSCPCNSLTWPHNAEKPILRMKAEDDLASTCFALPVQGVREGALPLMSPPCGHLTPRQTTRCRQLLAGYE